ncbi:MAG: helix-turn-helix transcriptional regulator [Propioniciclava sp.]
MGMTSASQVPRLLALIPYLQAHPDADLEETASRFGVSSRQLVADLKVLWFCGLPGGMPGDLIEVDMDALAHGQIRLSNADFLRRPLRLTFEETMSLIVALRAMEEMVDPDVGRSVHSARERLEAVFGGDSDRIEIRVSAGEQSVRRQLLLAKEAGQAVQLIYHGAARGTVTRPVVEPARLVTSDGYGYLVGWSVARDAWRTYRLDRIADVIPTQDDVAERGEPPVIASGWLDERTDVVEVSLDLRPEGHWIVEYHPTVAVQRGVGRQRDLWRVRLRVADPAWFRRLLLRLGPAVARVDPPEAARSAALAAREALAQDGAAGEPATAAD